MLTILQGDALTQLRSLPSESVQCCVTSPPFWGLRDYGTAKWEGGEAECDHVAKVARNDVTPEKLARRALAYGTGQGNGSKVQSIQHREVCGKCGARRIDSQLGLEKTPEEYVARLVEVFREVRRVLRQDGTLWLNLGDSYARDGGTGGCGPNASVGNTKAGVQERNCKTPIGYKPKDLVGIPWAVAFALRADGWYLRSDIIWAKPNPMPESVRDRPTKSHEYLFLLTKSPRYFYDADAISELSFTGDIRRPYGSLGAWELDGRPTEQRHGGEPRSFKGSKFNTGKTAIHQLNRASDKPRIHGNLPGRSDGGNACNGPGQEMRNKRSVWTVNSAPYPEAHFATYPPDLIKPCILAGSRPGDIILDPFAGSGTTGQVALELGRKAILIELNPKYVALIEQRTNITPGLALA